MYWGSADLITVERFSFQLENVSIDLSFQLLRLVQKTTEIVRIFAFYRRVLRSLLATVLTAFIFKLMEGRVTQVS